MNIRGNLNIFVGKAILTKDLCTFGTMDPYFTVSLSPYKVYKSTIRTNEGKFPIWNESCILQYENEPTLEVAVYHDKKIIGKADISIVDLVNRSGTNSPEVEGEYTLYSGTDVHGKIVIKIKYSPSVNNVITGVNPFPMGNPSTVTNFPSTTSSYYPVQPTNNSYVSTTNPPMNNTIYSDLGKNVYNPLYPPVNTQNSPYPNINTSPTPVRSGFPTNNNMGYSTTTPNTTTNMGFPTTTGTGIGTGMPINMSTNVPFPNQFTGTIPTNTTTYNNFTEAPWYKCLTYNKNMILFKDCSILIYQYNFTQEKWTTLPNNQSIVFPRYHRATELPDGSYLLHGGEINGNTVSGSCHYISQTFYTKESMKNPRKAHAHCYVKGTK